MFARPCAVQTSKIRPFCSLSVHEKPLSNNWTRAANRENYENMLILDDPRAIEPFMREFESLWERFQGNRFNNVYGGYDNTSEEHTRA